MRSFVVIASVLSFASMANAQVSLSASANAAAGTPPPPTNSTMTKADTTSKGPRSSWHPDYAAEIEPHFTVAGLDHYQAGLGFGMNVAVPIWNNAPIRSIDDTIAFGVGFDFVRYAAYKPRDPQTPNVLTYAYYVPVFVQWNVWLGARASFFLEPRIVYRYATYQDSCTGLPCVDTVRVLPSGAIGFRFRIVDHASVTVRVGWPMVTLGGSWL